MKTIVVPLNIQSKKKLDYDKNEKGDCIKLYLSDDDFYNLWSIKYFDEMIDSNNLHVDDFESSDFVDKKKVNEILNITYKYLDIYKNNITLLNISRIIENAIYLNTGVYFYF